MKTILAALAMVAVSSQALAAERFDLWTAGCLVRLSIYDDLPWVISSRRMPEDIVCQPISFTADYRDVRLACTDSTIKRFVVENDRPSLNGVPMARNAECRP